MMMMEEIKRRCNLVWLQYDRLISEPIRVTEGEHRALKIGLACLVGLVCALAALGIWWSAMQYNSEKVTVNFELDFVHLPDTILCPRPGFAVYPTKHLEPPENVSAESHPQWRFRQSGWNSAWMQRAPAHEQYAHNVWYNLAMIDLLEITQTDVDLITTLYRNGHQTVPVALQHYLDKLYEKFNATYDVAVRLGNYSENAIDNEEWPSPVHPRLQTLVMERKETQHNNMTLLWWCLVETRYVLSYGNHDVPTEREQETGGRWNRRFHCLSTGIGCHADQHVVWLDNSLCVLWRRADRRRKTDGTDHDYFYAVDAADELRVWMGNIEHDNIRDADFRHASLDADGWLDTADRNVEHTLFADYADAVNIVTTRPVPRVCQQMAQVSGNSDDVRAMFCRKKPITDFWLYQRQATWGNVYVTSEILSTRQVKVSERNSYLDRIGSFGNLIAVLTGLSVVELICGVTSAVNLSPKASALTKLFACIILSMPLMIFTVYEVRLTLGDDRYITEPLVKSQEEVNMTNIGIGGSPYSSRLTINHTKLMDYNVDVQLFVFMCIAATSKNYYNELSNVAMAKVLAKYWDRPYDLQFPVKKLKPSDEDLKRIDKRYQDLTRQLAANSSRPFEVLSHFFLDPCAIIEACGFEQNVSRDCCRRWEWFPTKFDSMIYMLTYRANTTVTFEDRRFIVIMNASVYNEHSDGRVWYLGPGVNLTDARQYEWRKTGKIQIQLSYGDSDQQMEIAQFLKTEFVNGKHLDLKISFAPAGKLMNRPGATCSEDTLCRFNGALIQVYRKTALQSRCNCTICERIMTIVPQKPCCSALDAVKCVTDDLFYEVRCNGSPYRGKGYWLWDEYPKRATGQRSGRNIFLRGTTENSGCQPQMLFSNESLNREMGRLVTEEDLSHCRDTCNDGMYEIVSTAMLEQSKTDANVGSYVLSIGVGSGLNQGTKETDTLQPIDLVSKVWGALTLVTGVTLARLFVVMFELARNRRIKLSTLRKLIRQLDMFSGGNEDNEQSDTVDKSSGTKDKSKTWAPAVFVVVEVLLLAATVLIVNYMLFASYENHIVYGRSKSLKVKMNETTQLPDLFMCKQLHNATESLSIDEALRTSTCRDYKGKSVACNSLFPIRLKRDGFVCAVTAHDSEEHHFDPRQAVYTISKFDNTTLTHFWLGDPRVFTLTTDLAAINQTATITELTYEVYNVSVTDSFNRPDFINVDQCSNTANWSLCSEIPAKQYDMTLAKTSAKLAQYNEFRYRTAESGTSLTIDKRTTEKSFRVNISGLVSYDIVDEARFNWAQRLAIVGGVTDSLISVTALNLLFSICWYMWGKKHSSINEEDGVIPISLPPSDARPQSVL